jgi:hypothetical protein
MHTVKVVIVAIVLICANVANMFNLDETEEDRAAIENTQAQIEYELNYEWGSP